MAHRRCTDSAWRDRGAGARRLIEIASIRGSHRRAWHWPRGRCQTLDEIGPAQNERGWIIAEAKSGSTLNPARSAANERRGGSGWPCVSGRGARTRGVPGRPQVAPTRSGYGCVHANRTARTAPRSRILGFLMALTSSALDLIVAVLRSGPPAAACHAVWFERPKVTQRIDSDIDIGIVPEDPELSLAEELTLQTDLARVSGHQVDLVRLDRASTLLRWQVVRYGQALIEATPFAAARFTAETVAGIP